MTTAIKSNLVVAAMTALFMWLILSHGCNTPVPYKPEEKPIDKNWTLKASTVDTIKPPDTVYAFKPKLVPVHDTVYIPVSNQHELDSLRKLCEVLRIYVDSVSDDNITIYSTDSVTGVLNSKQIAYRLKVPLRIETTNYITSNPTFGVYGGVEVGAKRDGTSVRLAPVIGLNIKKHSVSYSYEPLSQHHNLRYTKILLSKDPRLPKSARKSKKR